MTVINMKDQSLWWTMNMLKQSIALMKSKNVDGRYDEAITKEENILRSFFNEALGRSEAAIEEIAA